MNCPNCKAEVTVEGNTTKHYNQELTGLLDKYKVPFRCTVCGGLDFKVKAVRDIVFVWPEPVGNKVGSLILPASVVDSKEPEYGIVLSVGKGYWKRKGGRFIPTHIKVGDEIIYDKSIPWYYMVIGLNGKKYKTKYMGYQDVKALITEG